MSYHLTRGLCLCGVGLLLFAACIRAETKTAEKPSKVPLGLPDVPVPKDNPLTEAKVALGKQLFFDPRMSKDDSVSCATCHDPAKGWSNGDAIATGILGQKGGRSAPTVLNTAYQAAQFWDGRATTLEDQALGPVQNPIEMGMTMELVLPKLQAIKGYREQFQKVFGTDVNAEGIAKAIASYERTILSGNSPYDRFQAGDKQALSPAAQRGMALFFGKGSCSSCHVGPNFTDNAYHNIGIGMDKPKPDVGREAISKILGDRGSFKTPTVRDAARHSPYMHDGSIKTLEEVVEHYDRGGIPNDQLDEALVPLNLTKEEKADLVTFMKVGLASGSYPDHKPPELPK